MNRMPRYVGKPLIAKVHVIDANGDPVTGATVQVKVLDPAGQDWDGTWNANYYSDGVYYTEITPDESGDWTFIFTCSNPKFSKAIVYHVNPADAWKVQPYKYLYLEPPTQNQWFDVCDIEGTLRIFTVSFWQSNGESNNKEVELQVSIDNGEWMSTGRTLPNSEGNTLFTPPSGTSIEVDTTGEALFGLYAFAGILPEPKNIPRECSRLRVQARMTSANGTNQNFGVDVSFEAKGDVTDNLD